MRKWLSNWENPKKPKNPKTAENPKNPKHDQTALITNKDGLIVKKAQKRFLGFFLGFCSLKNTWFRLFHKTGAKMLIKQKSL